VERKPLRKGRKKAMTRRKNEQLRTLTAEEQEWLERISRSHTEPASHVARAKEILAVAEGKSYTRAAQLAGRKAGDAVSYLVKQFNREGIAVIQPSHGGGPKRKYTAPERERVLREVRRTPDPERDGTKTWSLALLQEALHRAEDGLPEISTERIWVILHEAGFSWQKSRSWCETGQVVRKRKRGLVTVTDPNATPKKT